MLAMLQTTDTLTHLFAFPSVQFQILSCDNAVLVLWLNLGTKATWFWIMLRLKITCFGYHKPSWRCPDSPSGIGGLQKR